MKMSSFEWFNRDSLHRMLPRHTLPTQQKVIWPLRWGRAQSCSKPHLSVAHFHKVSTACFWSRTSKILRIEDSPWSTKPRSCFSTKPWKFCFFLGGGWRGVQLCTSVLCKFPHATDGMWFNSAWKWSFQQQLSSANFRCGGCKRNFP